MTFGAMAAWQALAAAGGAPARAAVVAVPHQAASAARARAVAAALAARARRAARADAVGADPPRGLARVTVAASRWRWRSRVTRPGRAAGGGRAAAGRSIVLDSSWSMLARTRERRDALGARACAEARALAASAGGDESRWRRPPTAWSRARPPICALIETALDRLAPAGGERRGVAARRRRRRRALHHRRRGRARPLDAGVVRPLRLRAGAERRHHRVRRAAATSGVAAGEAYLEIANFARAPQDVRVSLDARHGDAARSRVSIGRRRSGAAGRAAQARRRARAAGAGRGAEAMRSRSTTRRWRGSRAPSRLTSPSWAMRAGWLRVLLERDPGVNATFVVGRGLPGPGARTC